MSIRRIVALHADRKNPNWDPFINSKTADKSGNVTHCILDGRHLRILEDGNSNG